MLGSNQELRKRESQRRNDLAGARLLWDPTRIHSLYG